MTLVGCSVAKRLLLAIGIAIVVGGCGPDGAAGSVYVDSDESTEPEGENQQAVTTSSTTVRVAIGQIQSTAWNVSANLTKMKSYIQQARAAGAKLIVFPELADTGFQPGTTGGQLGEPIPGPTSDALGVMAVANNMWIAVALLEKVPGGNYDTDVVIDDHGKVVLKQRKMFVGAVFGGVPLITGNYEDVTTAPSPWGPLAVINCVDTRALAKRLMITKQKPAMILATFANPGALLVDNTKLLATASGAPVVGVNMVNVQGDAGQSRFVSASGATLWRAGAGEVFKVWDLTVNPPANRKPRVDAGEIHTIRLPVNTVTLRGTVRDDGLPGGALTTTWSSVSPPGTVTFGNPSAVVTSATFSSAGVYRLRLTANDGASVASEDVFVNVLPVNGDPNLVGRWTFDGSAADSSGQGNNGSLVGGPLYSTDHAPTGGTNSHSLQLDGSNDQVSVPHASSLSAPSAVTMALWIKSRVSFPGFVGNGGNDWASLINKGNTRGLQNYLLGFGAYFYVYSEGMGGIVGSALDDIVLTPGAWIHVASVIDANRGRSTIYINGVADHMSVNVAAPATNTDPLTIGSPKFDGKIDEVRLYTRALSDAEIAALVPGAVVNNVPIVDAGPSQTTNGAGTASLNGDVIDDAIPATSATAKWTRWSKLSGPGDVRFANRYAPVTSATFTSVGTYVLELEASDGSHRVSDTVSVNATQAVP